MKTIIEINKDDEKLSRIEFLKDNGEVTHFNKLSKSEKISIIKSLRAWNDLFINLLRDE